MNDRTAIILEPPLSRTKALLAELLRCDAFRPKSSPDPSALQRVPMMRE